MTNEQMLADTQWPRATVKQIDYREELDREVIKMCARYESSECSLADLYQAVDELVAYDHANPDAAIR